jgi:hypothetical protein
VALDHGVPGRALTMATPQEMVERLTHAVRTRRGKRGAVMVLAVPELRGYGTTYKGRYLGDDAYGPRYGYTRRQCKRLLREIRSALADNARTVLRHAVADEEADLYTGDYDHE